MPNRLIANIVFATALLVGAAVPLSGAQAVTVTNGSFESGLSNIGNFTTLYAGDSTSITGWTITGGNVDYIGSYWTAADGSRSLDLNGLVPGSISQTIFGLTSGVTYEVTFDLAGNPAGGPNPKTLNVTASAGPSSFSFNAANTSLGTMGWVAELFFFTATGPSTTLTFASTTTGFSGNDSYPSAFGPALDNVSISATPLPSSWTMLIAGFVAFGFLAYRGTKKSTALAGA